MEFLDENGLTHLWEKIKQQLGDKVDIEDVRKFDCRLKSQEHTLKKVIADINNLNNKITSNNAELASLRAYIKVLLLDGMEKPHPHCNDLNVNNLHPENFGQDCLL